MTPLIQTQFQVEHSTQRLRPRFSRTKLLTIALPAIVAALALTALVRGLLPSVVVPLLSNSAPKPTQSLVLDRISAGETLLSRWQANPKKQEGVERLAAGEYTKAVAALEAARQSSQGDPETLIYLNNARIGTETPYKIAVAVPLGDTFGSALEILRGVAKAQDDLNRAGGINGIRLKVVIANDDNQRDTAQQLATALASQSDVLGVVGHGISDTTLSAASVYQANQLVMVSPLSSAVQLSNFGSYIFRTMPSDRLTAKALSTYMLNSLKKRKVVVFFNAASAYSVSLKTEFKNALFYNGVELMNEFDFSRPDFDAADSVETAIAKGAEVIMLASDNTVSDQAIQVVQLNHRRLNVLAGDSVSTVKILKVAGKDAVGTTVAVPADLAQSLFQRQSKQLWGRDAPISWRTALAYDATQALIAAIRVDPSRAGIKRVLSQTTFAARGATDPVRFLPSGDRQGSVLLVTIVPVTIGNHTAYEFKPLSTK